MQPKLVVITGPTASGKTALGVALAQRLGGEVVSADSMQIYRGMDIGTAKPTPEEMQCLLPVGVVGRVDVDAGAVHGRAERVARVVELQDVAGVSNQPLVRVLLRNGCDVTVCDRRDRAKLGAAGDEAAAQGAKFILGADYLEHLDFDVIFRTPGVLPIVPQLRAAAQSGAILTSEMEAFCNLCPCRIIAITGSDGKTTTSTITAELLRAQGYTVHLGCNIGTPLEMADTYGADALRFNLITGNSPGNDMRFYVEKCGAMRNFANKLWNASRFVMMNLTIDKNELPETLELEDKWVLSKLNTLSKEVCENLDKYEIGIAAAKIYDFIWDTYCDWYIELTKPRLNSGDEARARSAQQVLLYVLTDILKLLHPFMPFITEEIWQALPHDGEALMIARYPEYTESLAFPAEERDFEMVMNAIRAVRSRRAEMNVPPSRKAHLFITTDRQDAFRSGEIYITKLAYAEQITISSEQPADAEKMVSAVTEEAKLFMPMAELIDLDKERARLEKELEKARKNYEGQMRKLSNENFVSRAPEAVVQTERERAEKARALVENLEASLKNLG